MKQKLEEIVHHAAELEAEMSRPETMSNQNRYREINREYSHLTPIVLKYNEYKKMKTELADAEALLQHEKDHDMRELLSAEVSELKGRIIDAEERLMVMLIPRDPNSGKNVLMEIRAGTGGEEAALFVSDLFRMYSRYIDVSGWKLELISLNATEIGGYKEVVFSVAGADAYDSLKFESGVHRVQRIPTTESGGRIHTSAVTVAVLTEAEESDVHINPDDLRIDVFRASGCGGQHINTTDSAVRVTHIPSGLVVSCQDEKSQIKNKTKAIRVLRARLFEKMEQERLDKETEIRRSQVGSGDRSERIRTYNFPQSRVTDHRINLTLYSLETVLDGELANIIEPLKKWEIEQKLRTDQ